MYITICSMQVGKFFYYIQTVCIGFTSRVWFNDDLMMAKKKKEDKIVERRNMPFVFCVMIFYSSVSIVGVCVCVCMVIDQDTSSSLYHHQADTMAAALCRWLCRFAFFLCSLKKEKQKKGRRKTSKCKWRFERWWVIMAVWIDDGLYKFVLRYSSSVPSSVWYSSAGGEIPLRFDDSGGEINKYERKWWFQLVFLLLLWKRKGRERENRRKKRMKKQERNKTAAVAASATGTDSLLLLLCQRDKKEAAFQWAGWFMPHRSSSM